MKRFGIDIGGSGVKGAPVDLDKGKLLTERFRILTPQPSTPRAVGQVVKEILDHFEWQRPFGCAMPSVVRRGIVESAANIDKSWIGVDGAALFSEITGRKVSLLNDADAAGLAELKFGAARKEEGLVILLTFGTGIGSAMFIDGTLVPNTELGHLEFKGIPAEHYAAGRLHEEEEGDLSFHEWGDRVAEYLRHLERLFSPDLFVIGGGISKQYSEFHDRLQVATKVVPAKLRNEAGIVGAALASPRK
ncbi:MAG: ROK family protein [Acidimicrobiia bacterium]|nr:ROK family protein [Acidimicrobiia bacterium]